MRIIEYVYPRPIDGGMPRTAVSLGFFDGVHIGHRELILDTVRLARERGIASAVFTFSSESRLLKPGSRRIYPTADKLEIFRELGVDYAVVCDFDSVSSLSPSDFVDLVLRGELGAKIAVVGEDFRFGARASGDSALLSELMRRSGGDAVIHGMKRFSLDGESVEISSSIIREYLSRAELASAAALLGAPYTVRGEVEHGRGVGGGFGYPTLNLTLHEDFPLPRGVYRTRVKIGENIYTGLTNIGVCPTFGARECHAETYILDFSGDVYFVGVRLEFLEYIREERSFESPEELYSEIEKNINYIRNSDTTEEI